MTKLVEVQLAILLDPGLKDWPLAFFTIVYLTLQFVCIYWFTMFYQAL